MKSRIRGINLGRYASGQSRQTVNLSPYMASVGSNPSLPTSKQQFLCIRLETLNIQKYLILYQELLLMAVLVHYLKRHCGNYVFYINGTKRKYLKALKMILGGYHFAMINAPIAQLVEQLIKLYIRRLGISGRLRLTCNQDRKTRWFESNSRLL